MFNKENKGFFPNLKHLTLNWNSEEPITQNKTENILFPPSLTELKIFWINLKEHQLNFLSGLIHLCRLSLSNTCDGDYSPLINADIVGTLQNLKVLFKFFVFKIFFLFFF
jgi:hypothetical protein